MTRRERRSAEEKRRREERERRGKGKDIERLHTARCPTGFKRKGTARPSRPHAP
jgi:hypothetical protein